MNFVLLGEVIKPAKTILAGKKEYPLLSMTMREGLVPPEQKFKKRVASEDTSGYKVVKEGQLVVGFPIDEGVLSFQNIYNEAIVSPAYGVWDIKIDNVDSRYLEMYLKSPSSISYYIGKLRSTTARRRSLDRDSFLNLPVPLPPLEEQKRIAGILDQADALRRLRARALEKLNTLGQAVFQEMFGEVTDTQPLTDLVDEFRYGTSNKSGTSGYPTLRIPNVIAGAIDLKEIKTVDVNPAEMTRLRLQEGDLLFVRTNGNPDNVGRCAYFDSATISDKKFGDTWIYASYLIRARLKSNIDPAFVSTYLSSKKGRKSILEKAKTSAGQYNINIDGLGSLNIPKASHASQMEFAKKLASLRAQMGDYKANQKGTEALFVSLQSAAFQGRL